MQSYIIKVRRSDRNGLQGIKKIKLNKSPFPRGGNGNDEVFRALSEIKELIKTKGISKLSTNGTKNVLKYRTNSQLGTLSQIQNFPSNNVITSITNIDNSKVKTCVTASSIAPTYSHQGNPVVVSSIQPQATNIQTSFVVTSHSYKSKEVSSPAIASLQHSNSNFSTTVRSSTGTSTYPTALTITKPSTILSTTTIQNKSPLNTSRSDAIPQYTFQVKTPKSSIGSPTISSTSYTPIKTHDSRTQNVTQPIFIRKDLSSRDDLSNSSSDYKYEVKSDLDEEEFDEDFDEKDIFPCQPIRTFSVNTGQNKHVLTHSLNNAIQNNGTNKFCRTMKVSLADLSKAPKINVIGRSSFVPVSTKCYF